MITYQLTYSFELSHPAIFSNREGDPNLVQSEGYIPGSAVWGALAQLLIRKENLSTPHVNPDFMRWFLHGELIFLNAYPCLTGLPSDLPVRLLPAPISLRQEKTNQSKYYDLAARYIKNQPELNENEQLERLKGFVAFADNVLYSDNSNDDDRTETVKTVKTRYHYHTWRDNRLAGRALKGANNGAVFVYEAFEPGQRFEGRILGPKAELEKFYQQLKWEDEPPMLRLGRSRATQYGGSVRLELLGLEKFKREIAGSESITTDEGHLVLTLTSHLLLREQQTGYVASPFFKEQFPTERLAKLLKLSSGELELEKYYVRHLTLGNYSSVWRLPRLQWSALEAGSTFIFKVPTSQHLNLVRAERSGLGLRKGEGFGRFVLNWHGHSESLGWSKSQRLEVEPPEENCPPEVNQVLVQLLEKELLRRTETAAMQAAEDFAPTRDPTLPEHPSEEPENDQDAFESGLKYIKPALLGRLLMVVRNMDKPEKAMAQLQTLRSTARLQLERVRDKNHKSLLDTLTLLLSELPTVEVFDEKLLGNFLNNSKLRELYSYINWQTADNSPLLNRLIKAYLYTLLDTLSKKRRNLPD